MAEAIEVTGVMRDKTTIELNEAVNWPEGSAVRLRLELAQETTPETDETLRTIYQMRHQGRSVQKQ